MTNRSCSDQIGELELVVTCEPVVVTEAATHSTSLKNQGPVRYHVQSISAQVLGAWTEASAGFLDGLSMRPICSWSAGTFGPGMSGSWSHEIRRVGGRTAKAHAIQTTAAFAAHVEMDPLDEEPKHYPYRCSCTLDIATP